MSQFTHTIKRGGALSVIMTILALYTPYAHAAETCVAAPSCSELGYTLTSTADCAGTPLKCPFDKTKYFCTGKADVLTAMMPDYKKGKSLSVKTYHYMSENGWLKAGSAVTEGNAKPEWFINDEHIGTTHLAGDENSALYPVAKGDKVYHNGNATYNYLIFYPCRGN